MQRRQFARDTKYERSYDFEDRVPYQNGQIEKIKYDEAGRIDHLYFNIQIANPIASETLVPATFYQNLTQSLLDNPSEFQLSVIRFRIPTQTVPLFFFQNLQRVNATMTNGSPVITITTNNYQNPTEVAMSVQIGSAVGIGPGIPPQTTVVSTNPGAGTVTLSNNVAGLITSPIVNDVVLNLSPYSVTLDFNGLSPQQVFLVYQPSSSAGDAYFAAGLQPVASYHQVLDMFNTALATAFAALKAAQPTFGATVAPYFVYNPVTKLVSLIAEQGFWQPDAPAGGRIFVNSAAYHNFFYAFEGIYNGEEAPNNEDFQILVKNTFNNSSMLSSVLVSALATNTTITPVSGVDHIGVNAAVSGPGIAANTIVTAVGATTFTVNNATTLTAAQVPITFTQAAWQMSEEHSTLGTWTQFEAIRLTTASMPVRQEVVQASQFVDAGSNPYAGSQTNGLYSSQQILTDFLPTQDVFGDVGTVLQFFPQGPYRLVDLFGTTPLSLIDVSVYWVDRNQAQYLLQIPPQQALSIKLLFKRKGSIGTSD